MKGPLRLLLVLALVGAGLGLGFWYWKGPTGNVRRFDMLGPWGLGHELAARYPGSKVLIVSNPFTRQPNVPSAIQEQERSRIEGLVQALSTGGIASEVVYPELKPGALEDPRAFIPEPGSSTPLSFLVEGNAFDLLRESHPDAELIVSLIGVPLELTQGAAWRDPAGPRFAFFLPDLQFLNGRPGLEAAFRSGKLAALVLTRPGSAADHQAVRRLDEDTFASHFLLIHQDNLADVAAEWGELLSR